MNDQDFVHWGDGSNGKKNKKYKVIPGFSNKEVISRIYFTPDSTLYIANGQLFKEGTLSFEKKKKYDQIRERELVVLKASNMIIDSVMITSLSIGTDHVMILSAQGQVFTWGDNFFGQLGLGSYMLPVIYQPQLITKLDPISFVLAHNNNCFAISTNKKLYVWGSTKFLGVNLSSNVFKPIQTHSNYIFHKLKMNNDTCIAKVTKLLENTEVKVEKVKNEEKSDTNEESKKNEYNTTVSLETLKTVDRIISEVFSKNKFNHELFTE